MLFICTAGEKHCCERSQGDVAHLQEHQTGQEDGPRQSQEAPEEIPPSHSPVGTAHSEPRPHRPPVALITFSPAARSFGSLMRYKPEI